MPPRDWRMRIEDILDSIAAISEYTSGMDFAGFCSDRKTIDAVLRNLTVVGEAARNVPADIVARHSEIPWQDMRDMRNVVVHVYVGVNKDILWKTVQEDLDPVVPLLQKLLEDEG